MFEHAFKNIDDVLHKDAGEEILHRSPAEMMKEIAALDQESAELMERTFQDRGVVRFPDFLDPSIPLNSRP